MYVQCVLIKTTINKHMLIHNNGNVILKENVSIMKKVPLILMN
jgi:hypothetical protein